jgi:hypothetical protein
MDTSSRANRINVADVSGALEKLIDQFDTSRGAGLEELVRVRAAKFNGVVRDRDRLATQLGAEDPRVVALDRSLALHEETLAGFRSEIAVSSIDPPRVDQRSWAIHGNVYDTARAPLPGLTIALYRGDTWVRDFGYACTDDNGYFALTVAEVAADDALSLRLLRSESIVHTEPRPVAVRPAYVEYREIIIDEAPDTCAPPVKPTEPPPGTSRPTSSERAGTARKSPAKKTTAADKPASPRRRSTPRKK